MLDTLARLGFGTSAVNLMYAETAVIIGIIAINLPFTVLTLRSVFEGIDPRLEESAASMGADPSRAFWHVVFPLATGLTPWIETLRTSAAAPAGQSFRNHLSAALRSKNFSADAGRRCAQNTQITAR